MSPRVVAVLKRIALLLVLGALAAGIDFVNKLDSELAQSGVDVKGGTVERLCLQ